MVIGGLGSDVSDGWAVSRKLVATLMRQLGLRSIRGNVGATTLTALEARVGLIIV